MNKHEEYKEMIVKINGILDTMDTDVYITKVTEVSSPKIHYHDFEFCHNNEDETKVGYALRIYENDFDCILSCIETSSDSDRCILKEIGRRFIENSTI